MKNLALILLSASLLTTTLFSGDINVEGEVTVDAVVGFTPVNTESLTEAINGIGTFKESTETTIDLGIIGGQGSFTAVSRSIYVKTNSTNSVTMKLEHAEEGDLCPTFNVDGRCIRMRYDILGTRHVPSDDDAVTLTTGTQAGANSIGSFDIKPKTNASNRIFAAGTYSTTLGVVISVN